MLFAVYAVSKLTEHIYHESLVIFNIMASSDVQYSLEGQGNRISQLMSYILQLLYESYISERR